MLVVIVITLYVIIFVERVNVWRFFMFWLLVICNILLTLWQIFFIDNLGSHLTVFNNWWGKHSKVRRYVLLKQILFNSMEDDFDMYFAEKCGSSFILILFICNMLSNVYSLLVALSSIALNRFNESFSLLEGQLAFNLALSIIFVIWLFQYIHAHHLQKLRLFLDLFIPKGKFIYQILPVSKNRYLVKAVAELFELTDNQLKLFFAVFADQGELLDQMALANKVLKRKDACQMLSNNKLLLIEMKNFYNAVLAKINQGLLTVNELDEKQSVMAKQVKNLKAYKNGDKFVKQFQVIKELHGK